MTSSVSLHRKGPCTLIEKPEAEALSEKKPVNPSSDPSLRDLWIEILKKLYPTTAWGQFLTWFKDTMIVGRDADTIIVGLPLPMSLNWHLEHYRSVTLKAAKEIDPSIEKVVYNVDGGLKDNPERSVNLIELFPERKSRKLPNKAEVKLAEGVVSKILNPNYTLENFIVGSSNHLAFAASQAVAMKPGGKYNPLFLYGGVGLGKTHLLQAVGNAILKTMPNVAVVYTTSEEFTNQVIEAIRHQKMEQLRRRYRVVDVFIVDDVQFLTNKERTQEEFFHTFNALYQDQKQIILSADRPPQELDLEDRLVSRFERGMIGDLSHPDFETRVAILMEKSKQYELFLDQKVLAFIAEHAKSNVRELEGVLMQAVALYELEHKMPTVKNIEQILLKLRKDPFENEEEVGFESVPKRMATPHDVLEAVSTYFSVSLTEITGKSRVRDVLIPRQIAMYLMKIGLNRSYEGIGEFFNKRDHTTVMHAVNKIDREMRNDHRLLREVRALEGELHMSR